LVEVADSVPGLEEACEDSLPGPGLVRFNVLTTGRRLAVSASEAEVRNPAHRLFALYAAGQDVIGEIRRVGEARSRST
jgi:hypothetical protein